MSETRRPIFGSLAAPYRAAGYWPRPISAGSKACHVTDWSTPDPEIPPDELERWLEAYGDLGMGLLMGSPLPDGTRLGALDIDHDDYIALGVALLRGAACGRVGSKGAVFFVRVRGNPGNPEFRVSGEAGKRYGKVAECLFTKKLCVIPPTIYPETKRPYTWLGKSVLESNFLDLPIIEV